MSLQNNISSQDPGGHRQNFSTLTPVNHQPGPLLPEENQQYHHEHGPDDVDMTGASYTFPPPTNAYDTELPDYEKLEEELLTALFDDEGAPPTPPHASYHDDNNPRSHSRSHSLTATSTSTPPIPDDDEDDANDDTDISDLLPHWTRTLAHPPPSAFNTRLRPYPDSGNEYPLLRSFPLRLFPAEARVRDYVLRKRGRMRACGPELLNVTDKYWRWLLDHDAPMPEGLAERQRVRCDELFNLLAGGGGGAGGAGHSDDSEGDGGKRCVGRHDEWDFWMCGACLRAQEARLSPRAAWVLRYGPLVPMCADCEEEWIAIYSPGVSECFCDEEPRCLEHRIEHLEGLGAKLEAYCRANSGPVTTSGGEVVQVAYCRCGKPPVDADVALGFFCTGCETVLTMAETENPVWTRASLSHMKPWMTAMLEQRIQAAAP